MLLDTAGLLNLEHRSEPLHQRAVSLYGAAASCVTHSYVLAEYVPLSQVRRFPRMAMLRFLEGLLRTSKVEVIWVDEVLHREATSLLANHRDKTYSLCDAVSFVLVRRRGITEALTTDRHFEQEGFVRLLA